jgi:outer membrane receptor for monomeric catechols
MVKQGQHSSEFMRNTLFLMAGLVAVALGSNALASDSTKTAQPTKAKHSRKHAVAAATSESNVKNRVLTGSYIPSPVRRSGMITDGPNHVAVIDNQMIRNSGAVNLPQLLGRLGVGR